MPSHSDTSSSTSAPRRRTLVTVLGLAVAALVVSACIPLLTPAAAGLSYGQGPVDAVRAAAEAQTKCAGLTSAQLAAMMLVPTYPETGGTVPSPMTLSRWDNVSVNSTNARLFSFAQTAGPYVNAFFSPGIGPWQFDSAGGWNLSAAGAIDSVSSATQAAATIGYRYCHAPQSVGTDPVALRRYAWGPWYGCSSSNNAACEDSYAKLYTPDQLVVTPDPSVGRYGGMEQRSCDIGSLINIVCWYVNPALAQGSTGWRAGTYSPSNPSGVTPLPKPFYVVEYAGREYRIWIQADTGYDIGITADKPITSNARTTLVWSNWALLCDRTANRGTCSATTTTTTTPTTAPAPTTTTTAPPSTTVPTTPPTAPSGTAYSIYLRNTASSGIADSMVPFGTSRSAQVLMCDWNGDGVETPGSFNGGLWTVSDRPDGALAWSFSYGNATGDTAVCGDWDGNGTHTPGVYRAGVWYLSNRVGSGVADVVVRYGNPTGDLPLVGDWDGNGTDTVGVYRSGAWYLSNSTSSGFADVVFSFGNASGDRPVVGDWDGNGTTDPGVFRSGLWYLGASVGRPVATNAFSYGSATDRPLAGRWVPGPAATPGVVR